MKKKFTFSVFFTMTVLGTLLMAAGPVCAITMGYGAGYQAGVGFGLFSIDLDLGSPTYVGNFGSIGTPEGLAINSSGNLFLTNSSGNLYSIDTTTGAASLRGSTGIGNVEGLDFLGSTLLGVNFSTTPTVYSINTTNGTATSLITATSSTSPVRSATLLDSSTMLIRADAGGTSLFSFDLGTGNISLISSGFDSDGIIAGMDFASDGNLYGLSLGGSIFNINPLTGTKSLVADTGVNWFALAAPSPVPEPSTFLLLGGGLAGLAFVARRRKKE